MLRDAIGLRKATAGWRNDSREALAAAPRCFLSLQPTVFLLFLSGEADNVSQVIKCKPDDSRLAGQTSRA